MNAIPFLVVDPPGYVLDSAQEHGLKVLYSYTMGVELIGTPADAARAERTSAASLSCADSRRFSAGY